MHRFYNLAARLAEDGGFFRFQNDVVREAYEALGQAYAANDNEVAIVTKLVNAVNGKSYDQLQIAANKIHGSRSYVEFNFRDKPTTKELGDMAIISIVTSGSKRLLQRVCIIQNKKAKDQKWGIDPEQLFLLKNFPPLSGNRGIFRGMHDVVFRNLSGCLGAYGLLAEPGEMLFVSAPMFAEVLCERKSIASSDIGFPALVVNDGTSSSLFWGSIGYGLFDPKEWYMIMREMSHRIGHLPWCGFGHGLPFLGNVYYARDMYDFIRAWTQISIGEYTYLNGKTINPEVDTFANNLIRSAGLGGEVDFPINERNIEREFEGGMSVFLLRIDVEHKE